MEALDNAWCGSWWPLTNVTQTFRACHLCTFNMAAIFFRGHPYIWRITVRHDIPTYGVLPYAMIRCTGLSSWIKFIIFYFPLGTFATSKRRKLLSRCSAVLVSAFAAYLANHTIVWNYHGHPSTTTWSTWLQSGWWSHSKLWGEKDERGCHTVTVTSFVGMQVHFCLCLFVCLFVCFFGLLHNSQ